MLGPLLLSLSQGVKETLPSALHPHSQFLVCIATAASSGLPASSRDLGRSILQTAARKNLLRMDVPQTMPPKMKSRCCITVLRALHVQPHVLPSSHLKSLCPSLTIPQTCCLSLSSSNTAQFLYSTCEHSPVPGAHVPAFFK